MKTNYQIEQKDYVSSEELKEIYRDAHFFLNIGNLAEEILPSKLIQYISTGKPIIHICFNENDICLKYLKKYPNCLIIRRDNSFAQL